MTVELDPRSRPERWPANDREGLLSAVYDAMLRFVDEPGCRSKEVILSLVHNYDANQRFSRGEARVTEYEVDLINRLYLMAGELNFNSVKTFLYSVIGHTTRMFRMMARMGSSDVLKGQVELSPTIAAYKALCPSLYLYNWAYYRYRELRERDDFSKCIMDCVRIQMALACSMQQKDAVVRSFVTLMNDLSYQRGVKMDSVIQFSRTELYRIFEYEIELTHLVGQDPRRSPLKGVLMTQISNFILKSRNEYNHNHVLKYVDEAVARQSVSNSEIWMRSVGDLNDDREGKVLESILQDGDLGFAWANGVDTAPTRTYYVSCFSRAKLSARMQDDYGKCVYGYKGDRLTELLAPIELKQPEIASFWRNRNCVPALAQVVVSDVIYDRTVAQKELQYLCSIIDLLRISDVEKHDFLQEILQYWILSVKDIAQWGHEVERRYILFLYPDKIDKMSRYIECRVDADDRLRLKTTMFLFPDFILGESPVRDILHDRADEKRTFAVTNDYMYCHHCLSRDFDLAIGRETRCPICGSDGMELVKCEFTKARETYMSESEKFK